MLNNLIGITEKVVKKVKQLGRVEPEAQSIPSEQNIYTFQPENAVDEVELKKISNRKIIHAIVKDDENLKTAEIFDSVIEMIECVLHFEKLEVIYCEMANFILNIGQPHAAIKYYQASLGVINNPATYSLYLQCLLMSPKIDEQTLFNEAYKYNTYFKNITPYQLRSNNIDRNKVLRVGYLCHFFHNSVSESLLLPFLREHDRQQVQVYCYSDTLENEVPQSIQSIADVWRDTKNLSSEILAQIIKEDKIDILLELNGHCVVNRYDVLARKPAPIQINYYNQAGTTGMSTIDYILIGEHITLPEASVHYSEKPYYLEGISGIAIFPESFPEVAPLPYLKNHYITFGSFGASHKVNQQVIKLWCKVLKAVPNAKFFMKAGVLTHKPFLDAYKKLFSAEGVDLDRIHFEGMSEHLTMLERYGDVDIALDTYPHAGGTTTMEAIWQGVPVVSYSGERYSSQNGKVVNTFINHPELIAYSEDQFVEKAVALASDIARLSKYRESLRQDFKASPLYDAKAHAVRLEKAYRDMWNRYLQILN